MIDQRFVGRLVEKRLDSRDRPLCKIRTIGKWQDRQFVPIDQSDRIATFPDSGLVRWFDMWEERATEGSLVVFSAERSPDTNRAFDDGVNYRVRRHPDVQILYREEDVSARGKSYREALLRYRTRASGSVAFRLDQEKWLLADTLCNGEDGLHLEASLLGEKVTVFDLGAASESFLIDGERFYLEPTRVGHPDQIDLRAPFDITKTVLRKLLRESNSLREETGLSTRGSRIDDFLQSLGNISWTDIDRQRAAVAIEYFQDHIEEEHLVNELANLSIHHPNVEHEVARLKQTMVEDAQKQASTILKDAQSKAAAVRQQKAALVLETEALGDELVILRRQVEEAKIEHARLIESDADDRLQSVENAVSERLDQLIAPTRATMSEIVWMRALLGPGASRDTNSTFEDERGVVSHDMFHPMPFVDWPIPPEIREIGDVEEFAKLLELRFGELEGATLLSTVLNRSMPIFFGLDAHIAMKIVGETLVGGRMLTVEVDPGLLSLTDLLIDCTATLQLTPRSNRLLDFLLFAVSHPDKLFMVSLEGINRSATDLYLVQLLKLYRDPDSSVLLARPEYVDGTHPFRSLTEFRWPKNVLLIGSALREVQEVTALPISPFVWSMAVPILANGISSPGRPNVSTVAGLQDWNEWQAVSKDNGDASNLREVIDIISFMQDVQLPWSVSQHADGLSQFKHPDVLEFFNRLLPFVLTTEQIEAVRNNTTLEGLHLDFDRKAQ